MRDYFGEPVTWHRDGVDTAITGRVERPAREDADDADSEGIAERATLTIAPDAVPA